MWATSCHRQSWRNFFHFFLAVSNNTSSSSNSNSGQHIVVEINDKYVKTNRNFKVALVNCNLLFMALYFKSVFERAIFQLVASAAPSCKRRRLARPGTGWLSFVKKPKITTTTTNELNANWDDENNLYYIIYKSEREIYPYTTDDDDDDDDTNMKGYKWLLFST